MDEAELERRRQISFEQAEGAASLPQQLKTKEISKEFRAMAWALLYNTVRLKDEGDILHRGYHVYGDWNRILSDLHVLKMHLAADEYTSRWSNQAAKLKRIVMDGTNVEVLGLFEWIIRHSKITYGFIESFSEILEKSQMAYRLVENTIVPISNPQQVAAVEGAFKSLKENNLPGAYAHLRRGAELCNQGDFAGSIRESIHAVESVSRTLSPGARTLSPALAELEKSKEIHGGMRRGFEALYGFASDESGIRHPLLEKGASRVDEADALFMLGACSSFVSYLLSKSKLG